MKVAGIITEYNPFHNGHEYHIKKTRERSDAVVAVMSGNFVQRAEPSVISKFARAESAVKCGADLVLELPVLWSCANAERFAQGAVSVLDSLGCVDLLSFGSECGDVELIKKASVAVDSNEVSSFIKSNLNCSLSFASIREKAVEELYGKEVSSVLKSSNDILAVEYCRALSLFSSLIEPFSVKRKSVMHDSNTSSDGIASASFIRELVRKGEDITSFVPEISLDIINRELKKQLAPAELKRIERSVLLKLRTSESSDLLSLPDVSEGIENRIISVSKSVDDLNSLFENVKTKRYTHARIRRIILNMILGIDKTLLPLRVPYIRVLAFNGRGEQILKKAKNTAKVPLISKFALIGDISDEASYVQSKEIFASELYSLLTPKVNISGSEFKYKVYKE